MRALVLSDIHGNLEALQAVLAAAGPYDALWNLGDVVGYGASPNEVVQCMQSRASHSVRGNHDKVCAGIASADNFNNSAREAALWTQKELTEEAATWLRGLPEGPVPCCGGTVALSHGSPVGEDIYILGIRDAWMPLQTMTARCTFFGHTHLQGGFGFGDSRWFPITPKHARDSNSATAWTLPLEAGKRYLLNPGSVGQPRDSDPRAAFALYDSEASTVTFCRVPYDMELAQGRILLAGLPDVLAERLRQGR